MARLPTTLFTKTLKYCSAETCPFRCLFILLLAYKTIEQKSRQATRPRSKRTHTHIPAALITLQRHHKTPSQRFILALA
jgi:hypothetical protein